MSRGTGFCGSVSLGRHRGIAVRSKLWTTGQRLRVHFLGGSVNFQQRVLLAAKEWEVWANITFERSDDQGSEIRVAFLWGGGFWSYVGKDSRLPEAQTLQTMNLGWGTEDVPEDELRRIVLHEFGHALGLEHEHKSPKSPVRWNEGAVMEYYRDRFGWSDDYIRTNVLDKVIDPYESTEWDPDSIMVYAIPPELTEDGVGVPWTNCELSETDKTFIAALYPGRRWSRK